MPGGKHVLGQSRDRHIFGTVKVGEKGQIVALEVNMRPCGGFTPDMINFARSTNVYKIWADMIAFGGTDMPVGEHYYCPFAGRRDGKNFVYNHEQIMQKYQKNMRMAVSYTHLRAHET